MREFQRNHALRRMPLGTVPRGSRIPTKMAESPAHYLPLEFFGILNFRLDCRNSWTGPPYLVTLLSDNIMCYFVAVVIGCKVDQVLLLFLSFKKLCFSEQYKKGSIAGVPLIIYSLNMSFHHFRVTPSHHSTPRSQPLRTPSQPETPAPSTPFRWGSISTPSSITQRQRSIPALSAPVQSPAPGIPFIVQPIPNFRFRAKRFLLTYSQVRIMLD